MNENSLVLNAMEFLNDEKQSILSEVLKCAVCMELPIEKEVRICERGHHFCLTCHNNMKFCGICRGKLLESRNFVVEELVSKLGPILGAVKQELPPAKPYSLSPGLLQCLHQCSEKMPAFKMLPHLRAKHSDHLIEKVRSNIFSGKFSFTYNIRFAQNEKYIWSAHISDMGLFTVELTFFNFDFFGCVRTLENERASTMFKFQLIFKIPKLESSSFIEFSVSNCPVSNYSKDIEFVKREGHGLKIKGQDLLDHINAGSVIIIFFSVWNKSETSEQSLRPSHACAAEKYSFFEYDRKARRNRNRNMRRKRLREKLRNKSTSQDNSGTLAEGLSRLSL